MLASRLPAIPLNDHLISHAHQHNKDLNAHLRSVNDDSVFSLVAEDISLEVFSVDRIMTILGPNDCTVYKEAESRQLDSRYAYSIYDATDRMLDENQQPHDNRSVVSPPSSRPASGESENQETGAQSSVEAVVVDAPASIE